MDNAFEPTRDPKMTKTFPLANLLAGDIFDKRLLITSVEKVAECLSKVSPDFAEVMKDAKGYTLLINPVPYEEGTNQPIIESGYGFMYPRGGLDQGMQFGQPLKTHPVYFGVVPHGSDRVLVVPSGYAGPLGQTLTTPLLWDLVIRNLNGETGPGINRGFVSE